MPTANIADPLSLGYNALLATLNRTTSNGLTYLISYTWSKSIDLACSGNYGVEGCLLQNFYNPRADRSVSGFDLTNIFSANIVYELPFGFGKPFSSNNPALNYLIGGWQINGITTLTSGTPYSITANGDLANTGNTFVQANKIANPVPANRSAALHCHRAGTREECTPLIGIPTSYLSDKGFNVSTILGL